MQIQWLLDNAAWLAYTWVAWVSILLQVILIQVLYKSAPISFHLIQLSLNHFPPYRACTVHLNHFIYYLEAHWRFFCCHKFKHYLRFCEWTCCCCAVVVCNVANLLRQSSHWINGYTRCATLTWLNTDPSPRYAPHFCALYMLFDYWKCLKSILCAHVTGKRRRGTKWAVKIRVCLQRTSVYILLGFYKLWYLPCIISGWYQLFTQLLYRSS